MHRVASRATLLVALASACGPTPKPQSRPSLLDGLSRAPDTSAPARFRYHPNELGELRPAADLPDGARLFLGERGERWRVGPNGRAEAASVFAPERLVDAVSPRPGSWLFIGQTGGVYEAAEAMGPFSRSGLPPKRLARVAVTREALVGVSADGEVSRSLDFGETWSRVPVQGRAVDVEFLQDGRGLLLLLPERLLASDDHGRSFTPLDVPPFGAWALLAEGDHIEIDGALVPHTYTPGATPPLTPSRRRARKASAAPKPMLGPSALALAAGRADLDGDRYFELLARDDGYHLRHGSLDGDLSTRSVPALNRCNEVRLVAGAAGLLVACADGDEADVELRFFTSKDGTDFVPAGPNARGAIDLVKFALVEGGFVVTGVCPPDEAAEGCTPSGIARVATASEGGKREVRAARAPSLWGTALALASGPHGRRVYALGRRSKGTALGVFVSRDGGETFAPGDVPELELGASPPGLRVLSAEVGSDGTLSAVVIDPSSRQRLVLLLDESGRFISLSATPVPDAGVGAAGLAALSVAPQSGDVYESLDGGSQWQPVGRVPTASCGQNACPVFCTAGGCVIGDAVTRVGWGGQRESTLSAPSTARKSSGARLVQSTAVCRFDKDTPWTALHADWAPGAHAAALGESAWFSFDSDYTNASVTFYELPYGSTGLRTQALVSPAAAPHRTSLFHTLQIEGAAVLAQVDGQAPEVAWVNLFESPKARRFRLPAQVQVKHRPTRFATRRAEPFALTIGHRGLFFANDSRRSIFTDGAQARSLSFIDWPETIARGRDELLRSGDESLVVRFFDEGRAIAWRSVEHPSEARAVTVGLPRASDFGLQQTMTLAYSGDRPGLHVARFGEGVSEAEVMPFVSGPMPLGPAVSVPTQRSLASVPVACSERVRKATPRVVASYEPGTRHAVVISDPSEPMPVLVSGEAVLHGTPDEPCALAFDAETAGSGGERVSALVFADPAVPSWVFRRPPDAGGEDDFEFRMMSCVFDPAAEVPEEVFLAPGTTR